MTLLGLGFILSFIGIGGILRPFGWLSIASATNKGLYRTTGWMGIASIIMGAAAFLVLLAGAGMDYSDAGTGIFAILLGVIAVILSLIYGVMEVVGLFDLADFTGNYSIKTWTIVYIVALLLFLIPYIGWIAGLVVFLVGTIGLGVSLLNTKL